MSNLSDLIPAGGGQNNTDFVADGAIASGKPVILTAAGKAAEVAESGDAQSLGSTADIASYALKDYGVSVTYNETEDKLVAVYFTDSSTYPAAVVGTISGTSTSWGTPVVAVSASGAQRPRVETIPGTSKVLFCWSTSGAGYGQVGTISGTGISFGTQSAFSSGSSPPSLGIAMAWDSANSQMMVTYYTTYNQELFAQAGTISGTSVSFTTQGNPRVIDASGGYGFLNTELAYDTNAAAFVASFMKGSNLGFCVVFTSDGTDITEGTSTELPVSSDTDGVGGVSYDSTAQKVVFGWKNGSTSGYGVVGTVSGLTISFGTPTVFYSGALSTEHTSMAVVYAGSVVNTTTMVYTPTSDNYTYYVIGTVSGTDISFNTPARGYTDGVSVHRNGMCAAGSKACMLFNPQSTSGGMTTDFGYAAILQNDTLSPNLTATNLLGIASGAILDTATGTINTWGSRNEVQTSLTIGSDYYAQTDGTITTSSSGDAQLLGKALSATQINIKDYTG